MKSFQTRKLRLINRLLANGPLAQAVSTTLLVLAVLLLVGVLIYSLLMIPTLNKM